MPYTRTKEEIVYTFEELKNFPELKQKVLERYWDINIDHQWWECTYDYIHEFLKEALGIEVVVTGFDLGRAMSVSYDIMNTGSAVEILKAATKYRKLEYYNPDTLDLDTIVKYYKTCRPMIRALLDAEEVSIYFTTHKSWRDITYLEMDVYAKHENIEEYLLDHFDSMAGDLKVELDAFILGTLRDEYEGLTSEEFILESLEANEYEFYENGTIA
jgi:hypothetical protein